MAIPRILLVLGTVTLVMSVHGWSQMPLPAPPAQAGSAVPDSASVLLEARKSPIRLPSTKTSPGTLRINDDRGQDSVHGLSNTLELPDAATGLTALTPIADVAAMPNQLFHEIDSETVSNAFAVSTAAERLNAVRRIPSYVAPSATPHRIVRYEVPLDDETLNQAFLERGIQGHLMEVVDESARDNDSFSSRLLTFVSPTASRENSKKLRVVRYEVPADDIPFHLQLAELDGRILEPGMLRMPEVRFFQPKARIFMDLKQSNDGEFDLFDNGAILASLDVIELYFPMPLISERFSEMFSRPAPLATLGWRVGGTLGIGIATALNNGGSENGSSAVTMLSTGIRYEFPLGPPSHELLETRDSRLDQRTRVGMEFGLQGGISTREALRDSTDIGLYFGILVNTPWGG